MVLHTGGTPRPLAPVVPALLVRLSDALDALPAAAVAVLCTGLLAAAHTGDRATGPDVAWSIFYAVPVAVAAWRFGWRPGLVAAVVAAGLWLAGDRFSGATYGHPAVQYWNAVARSGFFLFIAYTLAMLRSALQHERALARTDWLTGLPNARSFVESARYEIARARRLNAPLTLAYIDLDGFKAVNDALGHAAGDDLLRQIAAEMRQRLRVVDIVARLSGDEFAVLLPDTGRAEAERVLDRLHRAMAGVAADGNWPVRFSVGAVSCVAPPGAEDLIRRADVAMYAAKRDGGDRSVHVELPPGAVRRTRPVA